MKNLTIGSICFFQGKKARLSKFHGFKEAIINYVHTGEAELVLIDQLSSSSNDKVDQNYLDSISDEKWKLAQQRYSIIKPYLDCERNSSFQINKTELVKQIASENNTSYATVYRWISDYNNTGVISSLVPKDKNGGRNQSRIDIETDRVINDVIKDWFSTNQRRNKKSTATEIIRRCKNLGVTPPHPNTVYSRLQSFDKKDILTKRHGYLEVSQKVDPTPGMYEEAKFPFDVVQIDHTTLDIIVVNDNREPIGRPNITLAIDVYSRMVAGLYISFDPPGAIGTGICLSNSILPKDEFCVKYDLKSEWPIKGVMSNIHMDNAPEFKGEMLKKAALEYGFNLLWRPTDKARYGGHIERLLGSFSQKIHALPGTTFSSIKYKNNYNSADNASLTLFELEKWLHIQIVDVYHQAKHSGIGTSPILKYAEGIYGVNGRGGKGVPFMEFDYQKVKLDFLPLFKRTIQRSGILIDHIFYYDDILKNLLYEKAWRGSDKFIKNLNSMNFIFKRDPRDISRIYFLNEKENKYYPINYADIRKPPISIWEHRLALKKAKELYPKSKLTEDLIFEAYNRLIEIEQNANNSKAIAKREQRKKKAEELSSLIIVDKKQEHKSKVQFFQTEDEIDFSNVEPFETDENI